MKKQAKKPVRRSVHVTAVLQYGTLQLNLLQHQSLLNWLQLIPITKFLLYSNNVWISGSRRK